MSLPRNVQRSIVYHELWHCKNNLKYELKFILRKPWCLFYQKPVYYGQEFEADKYALKMNGKSNTILMLKKLKELIHKKLFFEDVKRHPSIEDRINNLKNL